MNMKLKQLFLAIFATSVLFVSCSKDDVYEPVKQISIESTQGEDLRTMSTSPTV
jgi:predicted component of type VI protein secretion system